MRALWLAAALVATSVAPAEHATREDRALERLRVALAPVRLEDVRRWVERAAPAHGARTAATGESRVRVAETRRDSLARPTHQVPGDTVRLPVFAAAARETLPRGFGLLGIRPNPARGVVTVEFSLVHRSPALLDVLDAAGRAHLSFALRTPGSGPQRFRLAGSERLAPGIYWVRLRQGALASTRRAVIVR